MEHQITKDYNTKLTIITRKNLSEGQKLAQTNHSLAEFSNEHYDIFQQWKSISNSLIILECNNELELHNLLTKIKQQNLIYSSFNELDLDNTLTSICIFTTKENRKLFSNLPLCGKPPDTIDKLLTYLKSLKFKEQHILEKILELLKGESYAN